MFARLLSALTGFLRGGAPADPSRLILGSTGSGKSEGALHDLVRHADRRDRAVVLLDGHGPLAFAAAGHWSARGHEPRLVYELLSATDRVLCWDMLPRSLATDPARRALEEAETRSEVAQCFAAQRNLMTLTDRPWTHEWLDAAIALCLGQPGAEPLPSLLQAFRPGSPGYERLLGECRDPDVVAKFRELEGLRRRNPVQYEIQTGAGRRLVELVCTSAVVRLRSRPGPFEWLTALRERRLIAVDGGGIRSQEVKRTVFLLMTLHAIHAVRRHFAETRRPLPVTLVLEEAGALGLVSPFVLTALQELRKAGLSITIISQSSMDFGSPDLCELILSNTPWQAFYQCLAPSDQELGARVLANATFDPHAVHYTRTRQVRDGTAAVATESRGASLDRHTGAVREDVRTGTAFLSRYRETEEAVYKSPLLHAQEYKTALATLRVGERFVRDRRGVRRERSAPLRTPRGWRPFPQRTQAAIERVRRHSFYLPAPPPEHAPKPLSLPDAAARLRADPATPPG